MNPNISLKESGSDRSFWWWAGLLFTPIRWVAGFMFLSAFIRRVIQAPVKMDPTSAQYVGGKFADFLPHAIGIQPMLKFLLNNPSMLHFFVVFFTITEAVVGLFLILGFVTRLAGVGSAALSFGILLGSGWLGSTCVDEWQIGAILIATGLAIFLSGSGPWSIDNWLLRTKPELGNKGWFRWLFSGAINPEDGRKLVSLSLVMSIVGAGVMLWSYQVIHNGLWGKLHNDSKTPHLVLAAKGLQSDGTLKLNVYRDNGPDTYGSYIVEVQVKDGGQMVEDFKAGDLAKIPATAIENHLAMKKVTAGHYALTVPLAADSTITMTPSTPVTLTSGDKVTITVFDVSGAKWSTNTTVQ